MTARQPHEQDFSAEPEPSALEACAALVAHWDDTSDRKLEAAATNPDYLVFQRRAVLILAARRALEREGLR